MQTDIDRLLSEVSRSVGVKKLVLETDSVGMELTEDLNPAIIRQNGDEKAVTLEELKREILRGDVLWFSYDESYTEKKLKQNPWDNKVEEIHGATVNGRSYHLISEIISVFITDG